MLTPPSVDDSRAATESDSHEGKLDRIRDEVRGNDRHTDSRGCRTCTDGWYWNRWPAGYGHGYYYGYYPWGYYRDPYRAPYYGYGYGYGYGYTPTPPDHPLETREQSEPGDAPTQEPWGMTLSGELSYQTDEIMRFTGEARLSTPWRIDLDTAWSHYREPRGGGDDSLTIGDVNVLFRLAQSATARFSAGFGMRTMLDRGDPGFGPNVAVVAEMFPSDLLVVTLAGDAGKLGDAMLLGGRVTAGVMIDGVELFAGYDHLQIGDVGLGGPMAGLRAWL